MLEFDNWDIPVITKRGRSGRDAKQIELINDGSAIGWGYTDEDIYYKLISLQDLMGPPGNDGTDGKNGKDGKPGQDGIDGRPGKDGVNGIDGVDGEPGPKGDKGDKGDTGEKGDKGDKGDPGKDGINGLDGKQGPRGLKGDDGLDGKDGIDGKDGKDGIDGLEGKRGKVGPSGKDGRDGKDGKTPELGIDYIVMHGRDGRDGVDGRQGVDGAQGPAGPADWDAIENAPTTLEGYGITDAVSDTELSDALSPILALLFPSIVSATVEHLTPNTVTIVLTLSSDETSIPNISAFTILDKTISGDVVISGNTITLTTSSNFEFEEISTLSYTKPSSNYIKSTLGGYLSSFSGFSITNNVEESSLPSVPTNLSAVWINDFARLTVDDIPEDVQIEWYESTNGTDYSLVTTTALDVVTTDNTTWQNTLMYFKCRAKKGTDYSDYTAATTLQTPMVWKVVLTTGTEAGRTLTVASMTVAAGKTVNINWGDASNEDKSGANVNFTHIYAATGTYYALFTGDVNFITVLRNNSQTTKLQHSLTKLIWPASLTTFRMYGNSITGTIHTSINAYTVTEAELNTCLLDGDWSGVTSMRCNKINANDMTDLPRFARIHTNTTYNAQANNVATAQLDGWLAWLNSHITSNTPTSNITITLNGAGMSAPTDGASNSDIVAVQGLYTTAGYTATFALTA